MGKMSRDKGKRGELEACRVLTDAGWPARRGVQHQGGPDSPDIVCPDLPFHFEVKRTEKFNVYDAMNQATSDSGQRSAVVLHRRNDRPWLVVMKFDDWAEMARNQPTEARQ